MGRGFVGWRCGGGGGSMPLGEGAWLFTTTTVHAICNLLPYDEALNGDWYNA